MTPKISVLIPVYNVEQYIEQCLRSVLANTIIHECEVVIVNDCSPDKSVEIIYRVLEEFPSLKHQVKLQSHDCNRGIAAARNTALLQAHGQYIICVDSDDWVEADYLEELYREAEKTNADVVSCNLIREYGNKTIEVKNQLPLQPRECLQGLLEGWVQGWLHEKLIRRSLLEVNHINWVEGLDMWEDVLFSAKIFTFAKKISNVDKTLYHYRCNPESIVNNVNQDRLNQVLGNVQEIQSFLTEQSLFSNYEKSISVMKTRLKAYYVVFTVNKEVRRNNYLLYNELNSMLYSIPRSILGKIHIFCYLHRLYKICDFLIFVKNKK